MMIQDKAFYDIEAANSAQIADRAPVTFPTFMYDSLIMQYGLYNIAIKVLMQLVNALKLMDHNSPWGYSVAQTLGLALPRLRNDEVQIMLYSHTFFKLV
jgi:hypothetical protein